MSVSKRQFISLSLACALLAFASPAVAHGGFWRAYEILFQPDDPQHIVLRSDVWALIETHDGGRTWTWVCAELYKGKSGNAGEKLAMALLPGGKLLVANGFDGLRSRGPSVCDEWPAVGPFDGRVVADVVRSGEDATRLIVTTSLSDGEGSVNGQLFESSDLGDTFVPLGTELPVGFSATSARAAPSAPETVYVVGKVIGDADRGVLARSQDSGTTWELVPTPIVTPNWTARLLEVDPERPQVVYLWLDRYESGGGDVQPDSIWVTTNAGESWNSVFEGVGNLPGFAFSPDRARLLVAGPEDGIWSAEPERILAEGTPAFEHVFDDRVWGLTWREDGLYAGTNDFTPAGIEPFSLGISQDGGRTFEPVFVICSTEPIDCPVESFGAMVCPGKFSDPDGEGNFKEDFMDSQRCTERYGAAASPELVDAGRGEAGPADTGLVPVTGSLSGCACRMDHHASNSGVRSWWAACVGAFIVAIRKRKRWIE